MKRPPPPPPPKSYPPGLAGDDRVPYLSIYPGELLADPDFVCRDLAQRGAIFTLLMLQWGNGSLPAEPAALCRMLGITTDDWSGIADAVDHWFPEADGRRGNRRLQDQHRTILAKVRHNREAARKAANARWGS